MLISLIVVCIVTGIIALGVIVCVPIFGDGSILQKFSTVVVTIIAAVSIIGGICWWSFGTEAGKRAYKDQQSNISGGIDRTVRVFDVNGELIEIYSGKFDVETNAEANYVLFDDANGKRHMVYYTTGTVIIDEN